MKRLGRRWVQGFWLAAASLSSRTGAAGAAPSVSFGPVTHVEAQPKLVETSAKIWGLASDGGGWLVAYAEGAPGPVFLRRVDNAGNPVGAPKYAFGSWASDFDLVYDGTS